MVKDVNRTNSTLYLTLDNARPHLKRTLHFALVILRAILRAFLIKTLVKNELKAMPNSLHKENFIKVYFAREITTILKVYFEVSFT